MHGGASFFVTFRRQPPDQTSHSPGLQEIHTVQRLRFERPAVLPRRKPSFDGHGVEWDTLPVFAVKEMTINDHATSHSHRL
jgi:hypothetical protein